MLALRQPLRGRPADQFLVDPVKQTWGPKGFRFESLGEVAYYITLYQLDSRKINVCHVFNLDLKDSQRVRPATPESRNSS